MKIRKIILRFYNPIITITYNNFTLSMPFSHTIFINQKKFPNYDMQLHKIAQAVIDSQGGGGTSDDRCWSQYWRYCSLYQYS